MKRRAFLLAAPAIPVASALPVLAHDAATPVMRAFKKWREKFRLAEALNGRPFTNDEFQLLCSEEREAEFALHQTKSENAHDVLAKIIALTLDGNSFDDATCAWSDIVLAEAKQMVLAGLR